LYFRTRFEARGSLLVVLLVLLDADGGEEALLRPVVTVVDAVIDEVGAEELLVVLHLVAEVVSPVPGEVLHRVVPLAVFVRAFRLVEVGTEADDQIDLLHVPRELDQEGQVLGRGHRPEVVLRHEVQDVLVRRQLDGVTPDEQDLDVVGQLDLAAEVVEMPVVHFDLLIEKFDPLADGEVGGHVNRMYGDLH